MYYKLVKFLLFILLFIGNGTMLTMAELDGGSSQITSPDQTTLSTSSADQLSDTLRCSDTDPNLLHCEFNTTCVYGELNTVTCSLDKGFPCKGDHSFSVTFPCLYCWQLPEDAYSCAQNTTCKLNTRYLTTCHVNSTTYCLGLRRFTRYKLCNATTGHKWSMTMVLSILFGGFGVDRFYLGHWQEGVGKLFSFGGFGVWTLIDTILISIGYLKPADSSQYEY